MSVKIMTLVWERAPYTAGSLLVLLALADWANDEGVAWPSMERLAEKARIDRRSAQRIVRQLEKDGVLAVEHGGGRSKQHKYTLHLETATKCRPLAVIGNSDISDTETATLDPERATSDPQRATFDAETATPTSPDPLVEPSVDTLEEPSLEPPYGGIDFLQALAAYDATAKQRKVKESPEQRRLLFKKLQRWGEVAATEALENAVTNSWRGVFEPKNGNGNGTYTQNNGLRWPTAAEINNEQLKRNRAMVQELHRQARGDSNEVEGRNLPTVIRR